jgi:hypothetical protein
VSVEEELSSPRALEENRRRISWELGDRVTFNGSQRVWGVCVDLDAFASSMGYRPGGGVALSTDIE